MLEPDPGGDGTTASMHTTMNVTGRPAQFGRGVMVEVGSKLVEQFAQNLRQLIAEDGAAGGGTSAGQAAAEAEAEAAGTSQDGPGSTQPSPVVPAAATTPTPAAPPPAASADSINLVKLVGPSLLKRVIPAVVAAAGLALLGRWLFRRGGKD
jgi:uncharacterized membrane protein